MNRTLKMVLFGFLTWLIPFLFAFLFYSKEGTLLIDIFLFKSIMLIVGSVVGAFLLVSYFKKLKKNQLKEGIIIGIVWFAMDILLDLIILVPMSKMGIGAYFAQIGIRYLTIPIMSIAIGYVAKK